MKTKKGISLIVLIITIIVVVILSAAVIFTISQNSPVENAKEAVNANDEAVLKEGVKLANAQYKLDKVRKTLGDKNRKQYVEDYLTNQGIKMLSGYEINSQGQLIIALEAYEDPYIPAGFEHTEGTWNTGYVIKHKATENEFVWVPVDGTNVVYERYDFEKGQNPFLFYKFSEEDNPEIKASVDKYGGFYIARYEAGIEGQARVDTDRKDITKKTLSKKGLHVYNFVTVYQAIELSTRMANDNGFEGVTTTLVTSYLWDTTLRWMEQTNPTYPKDSTGKGNYNNESFTYTDINGVVQTKEAGTTQLVPTGCAEISRVNNIYDMAGNVQDWTQEQYSDSTNSAVRRGGGQANTGTDIPSAYREYTRPTGSYKYVGFRVVLYQ